MFELIVYWSKKSIGVYLLMKARGVIKLIVYSRYEECWGQFYKEGTRKIAVNG